MNAKPPGQALSSPMVNVYWALFNLIVGHLFIRAAHIGENPDKLVVFLVGIAMKYESQFSIRKAPGDMSLCQRAIRILLDPRHHC